MNTLVGVAVLVLAAGVAAALVIAALQGRFNVHGRVSIQVGPPWRSNPAISLVPPIPKPDPTDPGQG